MSRKLNGNARKGFASMTKQRRREVACAGGTACVKKMGRKHMARIGRKGGKNKGAAFLDAVLQLESLYDKKLFQKGSVSSVQPAIRSR